MYPNNFNEPQILWIDENVKELSMKLLWEVGIVQEVSTKPLWK